MKEPIFGCMRFPVLGGAWYSESNRQQLAHGAPGVATLSCSLLVVGDGSFNVELFVEVSVCVCVSKRWPRTGIADAIGTSAADTPRSILTLVSLFVFLPQGGSGQLTLALPNKVCGFFKLTRSCLLEFVVACAS